MMRPLLQRACAGALRLPRSAPRLQATWQSARHLSIKPEAASTIQPLGLDATKLTVEKTKTPGALDKPEDLVFGRKFTGEPCTNPLLSILDPSFLTLDIRSHARH